MKETYSHEFNGFQRLMQRLLGMWRINRDSIDFKWGYFAPRWGFSLMLNRGGYFDQRYAVTICLIWGVLHLNLPFRTRLAEGCDLPRYGICIHNNSLWLYMGGDYDESWGQVTNDRIWSWELPFVTWQFIAHEVRRKDGKYQSRNIMSDDKDDNIERHILPYTYTRKNGEVQKVNATCEVHRWAWHRKWLPWVKKIRQDIDFQFDGEVGESAGSWKGGVIGSSYDMQPGETVEQCFRRMEREREFSR